MSSQSVFSRQRRSHEKCIKFGNGVISKYDYNPLNRRLANLDSRTKGKENQFQDLAYNYDDVGNILGQANRAAIKSPSQMGGATQHHYVYDDLYRLVHANGTFDTQPDKQHRYTFDMQYDSIHNILNKNQYHDLVQPSQQTLVQAKTTYDWAYEYKGTQPHAPTHIGQRTFTYDANGNQTGWTHDENGTWRQIVWDEENRIQQIIDNNHIFDYKYNHAGERVIKTGPQGETVYVNQFFVIRGGSVASKHVFAGTTRMVTKLAMQENTSVKGMNTLAVTSVPLTTEAQSVSPRRLLSVRKKDNDNGNAGGNSADSNGQTKNPPDLGNSCSTGNAGHACPTPEPTPSEPVVIPPAPVTPPAEVTPVVPGETGTTAPPVTGGTETPVTESPPADGSTTLLPPDKQNGTISPAPGGGGNQPAPKPNPQENGKGPAEHQLYFYHPDHLGSTGYVTDAKGAVFQHIEYFPFGETWVEESSNTQRTPYGFTGKELDEETGLHYFGARYYDARTSVWASTDPAERATPKSPTIGLNLYQYGLLNPIRLVDPDGRLEYDAVNNQYRIEKGDTLSGISQLTGVSVEILAKTNGIKDVNRIVAGNILKMNPDDKSVRLKTFEWAAKQIGGGDYGWNTKIKSAMGANYKAGDKEYKCNVFVGDAITYAGGTAPTRKNRFGFQTNQYVTSDALGGNQSTVGNLTLINENTALPGDILTLDDGGMDHTGVYTGNIHIRGQNRNGIFIGAGNSTVDYRSGEYLDKHGYKRIYRRYDE